MKKTLKANAGAYLAMAQQAKGIAPETINALDRKVGRKLDGPKYSDEKLFAERGGSTYAEGGEIKGVAESILKDDQENGTLKATERVNLKNALDKSGVKPKKSLKQVLQDILKDDQKNGILNPTDRVNLKNALSKDGSTYAEGGGVKDIEEIVIKGIIKNWKKLGYDNLTAIQLAKEDIADSTLSRTNDKTIVQISKAFTDYSGKRVIQKTIWNITPKGAVIDGQYTQRILKGDKSIWTKQNYNYAEGGKITEINEDGSNLPKPLYELFGELNEDEDPYKEMERLKLKANDLGYDFDYDLSGGPTEFWKIDKMSGGGLIKSFSKSQLDDVTNESDLDDALVMAQENIGVDTGDVAGVFFSKYKDADAMWEKSTPSKRLSILKEYLKVEESYKMSGGGDVYDDFEPTIIAINRTAKMLFNRLRGPLKLSDKDYTPGDYDLDAEIKIGTKKFINVGPDGAYITEIHSNGKMSFSEPTSDLQKVISQVLGKKMSGGGKLERYDDMSDEEIIEWANENDLGEIAEKDIDGKIKNREEVLVTILELNLPNTDSEGYFLTEQFDDTYAHYDKGGKILKQSHLSSAEYQKAKKLKDFNDKNYKWNSASQLYDKTIKKMNGGYIESMGAGFDSAINELVIAFDKWKDGPMTEPEDVELAKSDILEYIESRLIVVPTINIYSLNPAGTLKTSQSVVSKLAKSRNIIKSFVEEPQSGAWMMTLKGYSRFVIYCTPFWEDFDGLNIAIMDSETDEELYSEEIEMPGTMSSIKTYQELYVFFATKYMPEILKQVKQLKSNMFSALTDNEAGNYYDIVDTGMNEWTYDWEYVGSTYSYEGNEWIDEAVNRDIDYFDTIYGNEFFSWHVQDETNGDMVGDVRLGTARQITKYINEELEDNQAVIFAGQDSIILVDDIYYKLPNSMAFRGAEEMKKYKLDRAGRQDYVMESIFRDISDYGFDTEEEKYIFASTKQFDDSTQIFDAKELKIYFRDDLIRTSIEWDERSARGLTKDKLQEFMGTADDMLIVVDAQSEYLLFNGLGGNDDNAKLWTADYVIGRNVLDETNVKIKYEDITSVEITSKQRQMKKGGGINSKYKKPSKSYTSAKVKKYINDNSRKFFDGGEITLADDYNWAEEVKYFAGDDYDKLTEQEKETIMSELKLNYEFHQSYKEGGKTGKMSKKYKKGDVVLCGKKGGTIQKVAGNYAQIKFDSGATDYVSFSKITG
jgi:hypothetical protein